MSKSTPENKVKEKLRNTLCGLDVFHRPFVATPMTKGGFPDRLVCLPVKKLDIGLFLTIEVKAHPNKPTALQTDCMSEIRQHGQGLTLMVDETNIGMLALYLRNVMNSETITELNVATGLLMASPLAWTKTLKKLVI